MKYTVYIPSMGRAGKVTTHKLFLDSVIVCPESEVKLYKKHHKRVLGVPNKIKGITATRNWILDNCDDEWSIQVDDDARYFYRHQQGGTYKFVDPDRINAIMENMFIITDDIGYKIWGLQLAEDYKFYRPYHPFKTQSVIGANILGIIKNPLRFDERLRVKEDYDYSMQHIYKYGGVLKRQQYGIGVAHLFNEGGCASYRTKDVELDAYKILLKKWGKKVVRYQNNKNFLTMKSPRKGI